MKHWTIRLKITLWFAAALILVVGLTFVVVFAASRQVIQKAIRDNLVETVSRNVVEVEYHAQIDETALEDQTKHFVRYEGGFLELDDAFLDEVNQVYSALYLDDGTLLYGENPIARDTASLAFADNQLQNITVAGVRYYVYDAKPAQEGMEQLWLRGVVSEVQGVAQMSDISRLSLVLLPLVVMVAIVGGYLIARRMLRPIQKLSESASQIHRGGDLKTRIALGEGDDELHQLARSFNGMIERLDHAFQTEQQFTSDASHELRTPMSVIMAQCELSLEEPQTAEEYEEALLVIQRQGRKMTKLINDMLDFTRMEMHAERYPLEDTDLSGLVESISADMALIQEKGIALSWDVAPEIHIRGNRDLLTRMLTNLIGNAYRYGREGGHIAVTLRREAGAVALSVADDGIGVAEAEQEKIFRRFYQADTSRAGAGTGLGLSMVQEIARLHGGEIRLESRLGEGSTFTFWLPEKMCRANDALIFDCYTGDKSKKGRQNHEED